MSIVPRIPAFSLVLPEPRTVGECSLPRPLLRFNFPALVLYSLPSIILNVKSLPELYQSYTNILTLP